MTAIDSRDDKLILMNRKKPLGVTNIMKAILIMLMVTALNSCAHRASFHTEYTTGIIYSVKQHHSASSGTSSAETAVFIDGVLIPIPLMTHTKATYLYAIKKEDGYIFTTESSKKFKDGGCVKLWHAQIKWDYDSKFNFVSGTLVRSFGCT